MRKRIKNEPIPTARPMNTRDAQKLGFVFVTINNQACVQPFTNPFPYVSSLSKPALQKPNFRIFIHICRIWRLVWRTQFGARRTSQKHQGHETKSLSILPRVGPQKGADSSTALFGIN